MITAIHRQQPNWPPDPIRPITQIVFEGSALFVETDGSVPTEQEVDLVLHPPAAAVTVIDGAAFLARVTDAEYVTVTGSTNVQVRRWVETLRLRGEIDVTGTTALAAKAGLVQLGLLTPSRADEIFAST